MRKILLLISLIITFSTIAFDIKSIDETEEGILESKKNIKAPDGKIIYKPIESIIINPMVPKVVQGNKPIVNPLSPNIIYPLGISPPKPSDNNAKESTPSEEEDDIFLTNDVIKKSNNNKELKIKLDTEFEKNTRPDISSKKPQKITPINIE